MNVRRIILGAVISAGSLLGAACTTGGDEAPVVAGAGDAASDSTRGDVNTPDDTNTSGPSNDPYVRALAAVLRSPIEGRDRSGFSEQQIACVTPRIVAIYRADRLEDAGIPPDGLAARASFLGVLDVVVDEDEAHAIWDSYGECDIDIVTVYLDTISGSADDPEIRECLIEHVTDDFLRNAYVIEMTTEYDEHARDDPGGLGRTLMFCGQQ